MHTQVFDDAPDPNKMIRFGRSRDLGRPIRRRSGSASFTRSSEQMSRSTQCLQGGLADWSHRVVFGKASFDSMRAKMFRIEISSAQFDNVEHSDRVSDCCDEASGPMSQEQA